MKKRDVLTILQTHTLGYLRRKRTRLFGVAVLGVMLVGVVAAFATSEDRTIHIFPTDTTSERWMKEHQALDQALSGSAVFADFNRQNSAFVIFGSNASEATTGNSFGGNDTEVSDQVEGVDETVQAGDSDSSLETPNAEGAGPDANDESASEAEGETSGETDTTGTTEAQSAESEPSDNAGTPDSAAANDTSSARASAVRPMADLSPVGYMRELAHRYVLASVYAQEVSEAPASQAEDMQSEENTSAATLGVDDDPHEADAPNGAADETGTETPADGEPDAADISTDDASLQPDTEDVRVCTVLGIECHTVVFNGFDIGSILSDNTVKGYTLRLSLAARPEGTGFTPDKLLVRYFYRGSWHLAGEITLDHELSNFDNGGHFAFALPDLESWDALQDFKVELEYVRHSTERTELYLDSVWVDAVYEVASADEAVPTASNILAELAVLEDSGRPDLLLADNKRIELTEVEAEGSDTLVMRSDADVYDGLTSARAYVAVTNNSDDADTFELTTHIGRQAEVLRIQERLENIPGNNDTPSYSEVAYYCEAGWELGSGMGMRIGDEELIEEVAGDGEQVTGNDEDEVTGGSAQVTTDDSEALPVDENIEAISDDGEETRQPITHNRQPGNESSLEPTIANLEPDSSSLQSEPSNLTPSQTDDDVLEDAHAQATNLSSTYTCKATGEIETCNSFNADKTNCIVGNERVNVDATVSYEAGWKDVPLVEALEDVRTGGSILARLFSGAGEVTIRPNLTNVRKADKSFDLLPRETRFFAIDLKFPVQRAGEFLIEAVGENSTALRSAWWRSGYHYRVPVTLVPEAASQNDVPVLHEISITRDLADLFENAALDGKDVRFYDASRREELPVKELNYRYVDQEARYGVELTSPDLAATTSVYAYFGNDYVYKDERRAAPTLVEEPIEYFGLSSPVDGAVLRITSERQDNSFRVTGREALEPAPLEAYRTVLLRDSNDQLFARGPLRVTLADEEYRAQHRSFELSLPPETHVTEVVLTDGRKEYTVERFALASTSAEFGTLETLPIPAVSVYEPLARPDLFAGIKYLRELRDPRFHTFREALRDFELGDRPEFMLKYQAQRNIVSRFFRGLFRDRLASVGRVQLLKNGVPVPEAQFEIVYGAEGEWTIRMIQMPRSIVPGLYSLEISVDELGTVFTDAFDFYWGVLAINTPQATYAPNDTVEFHMAALDDKGETICNAELHLTLTDPNGDAQELGVEPQSSCGANNVTDDPDYLGAYRPEIVGTYSLQLTHVNQDGDIVHQVADSFEVRDGMPFTIRRTGATRIWPKATYVMQLELTASSDFTGQFVESVPKNFVVIEADGAETDVWGGAKRIVWDVELKAGDTQTFSYEYDAPDVSPYLYLLGPAEVRDIESIGGAPFVEGRAWKLASDALGTYVELAQPITVTTAATWETKDLSVYGVPANAVVEIAALRNGAGTVTAGARASGSALDRRFQITRVSGTTNNALTLTVQSSATSSIQVYGSSNTAVTFRLLGYWTSGTYTERMQQIDPGNADAAWGNIPLSAYGVTHNSVVEMVVGNWNTGADYSAGIRSASSTVDRRVTLTRSNNNGFTPITYLAIASSTTAAIQSYAQVEGNNNASIDFWLVGFWSSTTVPTNMTYVDRMDTVTVPGSATTWTDVALDSFGLGKYTVADMLAANSGLANSFLDLGVRANGSAVGRTLSVGQARTAGFNPLRMHVVTDNSASSTIENYVSATANANFRLLGYWRPSNYPPDAPTLTGTPFNNEKTGSSTPYFDFTATDSDGSSDLVYQFQYDDDADLDVSPIGSRTSDDESGCSPNCFTNVTSGGDTSPFTEGNTIRFSIQSALTTGTTYYWRVRAKDVTGLNDFGEWSETYSFTYVEDTDPKAWLQTGDAQFETGTLSGTETNGSGAVQISTSPATGAMVAYGEGAIQTPRYQTWNGSVWSGQASALDVGGQISWTKLVAAPTRNEYILGTQDTNGDINVQVYNGGTGTWGNLTELALNASTTDSRAFDIAYRSLSGDAVVVVCEKNMDPSYAVWNGATWTSTTTIDLSFPTGCQWASLAANPASDEVILLAQASSLYTGNDFEAQVLTNTTWGNTYNAGNNTITEEWAERMNVAYEESGDEAVIVLGNGNTANFVGAVWNTANQTWTPYTSRTTQDDFEWGYLAQDEGTNNLALCYMDEDAQIQIANWNGTTNAWDTYVAGTFQVDADGNGDGTYHGRSVSCQYETTAGRDGYLMIPYTDESNGRYRVWTGSAFAATEQSISTIEEAWTVSSVRTGDGKILAAFRDDVNNRYDFSYWNGSIWSARENLVTGTSDNVSPFSEPIDLAAQVYQESSGSFVSPIVDFDIVPGRPTWGELLWNTTEPVGSDITVRVYYATTTSACNVLVPDAALTGNSAGYAATSSPLNLSGLSTSTYNMLCVKASFSATTDDSPTLDEWSISWERQPYLTQTDYRWYANEGSYTPSDSWPLGIASIDENTRIGAADAPPKPTDVLRLRMALTDSNIALPSGSTAFKLQWSEGNTCSADDLVWQDVADAASSTALWRGYENTISASGWYDASFEKRIAVTINQTYIDADLTDFPVAVNLAPLGSTFWSTVDATGGDIRITRSDGVTEVAREVVAASTTTQTGEVYFRANSISSTTDTTFYLYYGSSTATDYATNATYGAQNVWTGFDAVYHLGEEGNSTASGYLDSTANVKHGTGVSMTSTSDVTGKLGKAQTFDGAADYISLPSGLLDLPTATSPKTVTAWAKVSGTDDPIVSSRDSGAGNPIITLTVGYDGVDNSGGNPGLLVRDSGGGGLTHFHSSVAVNDGGWHHIGYTVNTSKAMAIYVDATQRGTATHTMTTGATGMNIPAIGAERNWIATGYGAAAQRYTLGDIDEVRISSSVRSAAWLTAEYQNGQGNLYTTAAAESLGDGYTIPSTVLINSDVRESYEEQNSSVNNPNTIPVGQQGEWDWVIQNNGAAAGTSYCFRMMNDDGTLLNSYTTYPQLITNDVPETPNHLAPFDNNAQASTSPWFEFVAFDPEVDDLHYEIQIDDDIAFGSPTLDRNSLDDYNEFKNLVLSSDKSPFTSGQRVRFTPTSALSNNTTYWWRVRAKDPTGANGWSDWSVPTSMTVNTSLILTTWYQTTFDQFDLNTHDQTEATSTNAVVLTPPNSSGTSTGPEIDFSWVTEGNAWGSLNWTEDETFGTLRTRIEFYSNGVWALIPNTALVGNSAGFATGPVSLLGLDPSVYSLIRPVAYLQDSSGSPRLNDWTLSWGYAVSQPTLLTLFDNEKMATTTPSFTFYSSDPQSNDLQYEFQWSSTPDFAASTTRMSGVDAGFINTASSTDVSPFVTGNTIRFTIQLADALTNGSTYWWRVRARDPAPGDNTWSVYSVVRSFTVDTSVPVSTWFQTTDEQFDTDTLTSLETYGSDELRITSTVREALVAYTEGVVQTPRYRLWNGTAWGTERSAENIGERPYWIRTDSATTRNEYIMGTGGLSGLVKAQIYDGDAATWGDLVTISTPASAIRRGFDVAYETLSGEAMVAACSGTDAVYRTWDGNAWSATSTINFGFTQNCEWLELASDPSSNEIIVIARANSANTPYAFEAQVWNGAGSWGNAVTQGAMEAADAENIGMAVMYEESGDQAVFVTSNGTNANFHYRTWNGSWSATTSTTTADDVETPKFARDLGSDNMTLCFVANNSQMYYMRWNGSGFVSAPAAFSADTNSKDGGHSFDCEYESVGARDGYIMMPYTDGIDDYYRYFSTSLQAETPISTIQDAWAVQTVRTGDGLILAVFYDETTNTQYDFSYWDGISTWAPQQILEGTVNAIVSPIVPIHMSARRYTSFTSGSVVSSAIHFSDGAGPGWATASSSDTTPGASSILYRVEYSPDDGETWALVPDSALPGNAAGTTANSIDLTGVSYATYDTLRLTANFVCDSGNCPKLHDWTVAWTEGLTVAGTAKQYDLTTNVTSGTVAVAVNGVVQAGKTGTISGGTWSIPNVTFFPGDTVEVWVDGAADTNEAVAVATAVGSGSLTGMKLYEGHLSIGSDGATTTTNALLGLYDNSVSGDEDIFFDVDSGNDLSMCATTGCSEAGLVVGAGQTYRPDLTSAGNITTHDIRIDGTLVADGNTLTVSGSWDNNGTSTPGTSALIFSATSTSETIDSTGAVSSAFNNVTFGQGSGSATWTLASLLDVNGNMTVSYGTLSASTSQITLAGNLSIGASGAFAKGTATTTFDGTGIATLTDTNSTKHDLGVVYVNGTAKTLRLSTSATTTDITIAVGNTFDVTSSNHALEVRGDFNNLGTFTGNSGTVFFTATTSGRTIRQGPSSLVNMVFNGVGGNWAFPETNFTVTNNVTIQNGIVTLPTGNLSIGGSLSVTGGQFVHNNGTVKMTATTAGKTVTPLDSPFYDLDFFGSGGAWSFGQANATTSNDFRIDLGTVTLPTGILSVSGDFHNEAGVFTAGSGAVHLKTTNTQKTVKVLSSAFNNLVFSGSLGGTSSWYNTLWQYRIPITIDQTRVDDDLTNFPVYVNLADLGDAFWSGVSGTGADIRVTTSDGSTEVPFELVTIATTTRSGELYFRANSVSSTTNTQFYLYYSNTAATAYASTSAYGSQNVWTNGYDTVLHLHENPAGTAPQMRDVTSFGHNGTTGDSPASNRSVTGKFGNAFDMTSNLYYVDFVNSAFTSYTYSMWLKPSSFANGATTDGSGTYFMDRQTGSAALASLKAVGGTYAHQYRDNANGGLGGVTGGTIKTNGEWQFVAWGRNSGVNFFVHTDGTSYTSSPVLGALTPDDPRLGNHQGLADATDYNGIVDEVRVANTARSAAWLKAEYWNGATTTAFYATTTPESYVARVFLDTNATVNGNTTIASGLVVFPTGTLTLNGSFTNASGASFDANNGTVLFSAASTGFTVDPGASSFATTTFNNALGGWTVSAHATSTGPWSLTSATSFTLASGKTMAVGGTFTNSIPSATTWTGSVLRLSSGTSYTVGTKTQAAESYERLEIGPNTDIRLWQSTSTTYSVDSTGSLYSQDHNAVDGSLYIWGDYVRSSGTDYWSYNNDFDGTGIGGSPRQVNVRFASGTTALFSGATLHMLGSGTASTTLANQGSGSFSLTVTNGTINAQYYSMTNLGAAGFSILGSTTITSLADGAYTLTSNGGTMVTVSSSTIDLNPTLQIQRNTFATSSGISSGYNVTASGTPSSYWWYRNHSGNRAGEAYDNDSGNPGSVRWDDSGYTISVAGTVYAGEGTGGAPAVCNGSTQVVRIVVNGGASTSAACAAGTGTFTIPAVTFSGDAVLTAYLDTNGGVQAATVTRGPSGNITGFNLYQNRLIVRHEGIDPLTIANIAVIDGSTDSDLPYRASSTALTLTVNAERGLHVWGGKTFAPGGNVTLLSGGSGNAYDGLLRLAGTSTFTAVGTESHSIGGGWIADTGATFTPANSTVTFTATTSGKTIAPSSSFYNMTFSGTNGGWTIASSTTVSNNVAVSSGTVSGTGSLTVQNGTLTGNGTVNMTGGTVTLNTGGTFGGTSNWEFNNLTLGAGGVGNTTKNTSGNITVRGALTVAASHTLNAGAVNWILTGAGSALSVLGTFNAETSTTTFAGSAAMTVPALTYNNLVFATTTGSPTYTLAAGSVNAASVLVGDGVNAVTVQANTNDPLITVSGNFRVTANAVYQAASANDLRIAGSYTNQGTFTSNGGGVVFNSSDTGETVTPGASSFHHLSFNSAGGGWTILGNATSTGNLSLTAGTSFTQNAGTEHVVQGAFTNAIGGGATTWTGTTLYLNSGTAYAANTKTAGGDTYGTLRVGANTDIALWNSTSTVYSVDGTGSLYSQDHNGTDGSLYIWGDYVRASGSEHWSYATDFDGADLSSTPRIVNVRLAPNATTTLSGGTWSITGGSTASTTIATQGGGTYALRTTGGTFSAQYYRIRDISSAGLQFSGAPTVSQLSDGDLELGINGGTMMTVAGTVIDANPVKNWQRISFATSSGVSSGSNVTATGSSVSSWRFIPAYGNFAGEGHDNDPAGDPGYLVWSDSAAAITISGNVYGSDGVSVSSLCNGSTKVVSLVVEDGSSVTASTTCAAGTGLFTIPGINYGPNDSITVYLDGTTPKAATITVDPVSSISDMHIYENHVIVRHEDTDPITITDLAAFDSDQDVDIPFDADLGGTNTYISRANTKLLVWAGKSFSPGGNVTLTSGGSGTAYDGTFELQNNATYISTSSVSESISVGGSWLTGTGAVFTAGSSTVTFTATTSGKTISPDSSSFYNLVFNGSGGAWTFADVNATTTNDFTVSAGSVTVASSTVAVGGSLVNSATMSAASTTFRFLSALPETVTFGGSSVGSLIFAGAGLHTITDTNATSTGSVSITAGSVALPSGTFAVANGFTNTGGSFTHGGTLRLYGTLAAQSLRFGTSLVRNLSVVGSGSWAFADTHATTTGTTTISAGGLTAPTGSLAIGASFINSSTFNANAGLLYFYATSTGQTLTFGSTTLAAVTLQGSGGGWRVTGSATTSGAWRLKQGTQFTVASSTTLEVQGAFENLIGGTGTDWTNSSLYLNASGTSYTINTKAAGGDSYAYLTLGANTDVRAWDSVAGTTTVPTTSSLYSMDHNGVAGDLYIWGEYVQASGNDYWSYATDFDGTALGGSSRQVDVRIATSSTLSFTGGTLEIVGTAAATTTIAVQGTGGYTIAKSGGTINAQYYQVRNLASTGIVLSGATTVTSLSYGDLELGINGGILLQVASTTINQNPSKQLLGMRFASSSGVATGTNIKVNGTSANFWDITGHYGGFDGEYEDDDGIDACGSIRWDDSTCLEVTQAHYRFRADDGGEGAPANEWFDPDWTYRKRVTVTNPNGAVLTDIPVRLEVPYDAAMLTNFDDLRFTDSSGTTTLAYSLESYTSSATATVWVKIPSLPASSAGSIFMYYGNSFAANAEDGASTFTFFDDFEDNSISEYSGDTSSFATNASFAWQKSYGLSAASGHTSDQTTDGIFRTGTTFGRQSTIEFYQKVSAGQDDEPCTLFGVQSPGTGNQNYAVCLDQYPTDRVVLAKNISSNDTSGTTLASSTVSFTSQWYKVRVDWLNTNAINVTVYRANGTTLTTVNGTDSSYTTGGMGFAFWYQAQGWDYYTVRPYAASAPTYSFGTAQQGGGASWVGALDTPVARDSNTSFRIRMSVENSGPSITGQQFRLQYAPKTGNDTCAAVPSVSYNDVPVQAGCGVNDICMVTSPQYANQDTTTQHLETSSGLAFASGRMVEDPSNQGNSMTLATSTLTELEYAVELTSFANESSYCLRTTNGGVELDSYGQIAEVSVNGIPTVTAWSLNNDDDIVLIEGQTVTVFATGTVSDVNGFEDLLYATTTVYRSGVGSSCAENLNSCYPIAAVACPLDNCSGMSCDVNCSFEMQYFADPTDPGSTYAAEDWRADLFVSDVSSNVATATTPTNEVDVLTMRGISVVSGDIDYGILNNGDDTGGFNETAQVQNSGNVEIDLELEGTDLTSGASTIPVGNQKFATSSFTYASCVICSALSGTPDSLEVDLPKPTSTSTPVTDDLYWGIYVPMGVAGTTHRGHATFYAIGD